MKLLCLQSGLSKITCDDAGLYVRLYDKGMQPEIIGSKSLDLKGRGKLSCYENMDGVPIHRFYRDFQQMYLFPQLHINRVLRIAESLKPDLIFCCNSLLMPLALLIQKRFHSPIALRVEDAGRLYSGEAINSPKMRFIMKLWGIPFGRKKYWQWLHGKSEILITCHPRDQKIVKLLSNDKPIFYLPWPSNIPSNFHL